MNSKSRRLSKLVSVLNNEIDELVKVKLKVEQADELIPTQYYNNLVSDIEDTLKIINFELSYLQLKKMETK